MKKSLHVLFFILIFFTGCTNKIAITASHPYLVTIKNKHIALADTGFLNYGEAYANLQIFSAGTALFSLEVTSQSVCLDGKCEDKLAFNRRFFEHAHYEDLISDIVAMRPIYEGQNVIKIEGGFEQEIVLPNRHIIYRVEGRNLYFKESKNGILMRLKEFK